MKWNNLNSREQTDWNKLSKQYYKQQWIIEKEDNSLDTMIWHLMYLSSLQLAREN